ncbi:MAG: rfaE bifunctional protein, domain II [Parcubacteria group bacterium LiPW_15]|nr:MAG: rfaE bifunctional protein, domain II [Parcubacteria group bacterium LiPW_15]
MRKRPTKTKSPSKKKRSGVDLSPILNSKTNIEFRFIPDEKTLAQTVAQCKLRGLTVVLTQGVYDLIHEGHAKYLEAAKSYGDILIVGVDSDELTRKRKGPNRPIVPQEERIKMLSHLRHVDIVTIREAHQDIGDLIRLIRPDVLVTSSSTEDFKKDLQANKYAEYCERIVTLPPQATTTTSARIRNLTIEGAEKLANEVRRLTQNFLREIRES